MHKGLQSFASPKLTTKHGKKSVQPPLMPFLRWAGSKRRLIPELLARSPIAFGRYVEPFGGSLCLFFEMRPVSAILADFNQDLIDTYRIVRAHPLLVARMLAYMEETEADYYEVRQSPVYCMDEIERAARFIFLNRNCFNGVYRTNRKGEFNVPKGTRVGAMPNENHLRRCATALRNASLYALDFEETISMAKHGDFLYLDPPYAKTDARARGEYGNGSFSIKDLTRLKAALEKANDRGVKFLLSYAKCDDIEPIKQAWYSSEVAVVRQIAGFQQHRYKVSEVLISNLNGIATVAS